MTTGGSSSSYGDDGWQPAPRAFTVAAVTHRADAVALQRTAPRAVAARTAAAAALAAAHAAHTATALVKNADACWLRVVREATAALRRVATTRSPPMTENVVQQSLLRYAHAHTPEAAVLSSSRVGVLVLLRWLKNHTGVDMTWPLPDVLLRQVEYRQRTEDMSASRIASLIAGDDTLLRGRLQFLDLRTGQWLQVRCELRAEELRWYSMEPGALDTSPMGT